MDLDDLIQALSKPSAYRHPVDRVEVRQTHISIVFLAGDFAYKIKKAVNLGFLDFSTLDKRQHFCAEEVRLNRRLAPSVYLGVVPVAWNGAKVRMDEAGEVVEWAVKMERLPDAAALENRLARGEADHKVVESLGRKIAYFHQRGEKGECISLFGRFDSVARNARENFDQSAPIVGAAVSDAVHTRLRALTAEALASLRPLIERRADQGLTSDTHGDLRLDHVYLFPEREPPGDLVVIDCIEFSERFRFADPVADMAFLVMDLKFHGRTDLADVLSDSYFQTRDDGDGRALLPFYTAYRAVVRAKVEGLKVSEKEIPELERAAALIGSRGHWLLALGELEKPSRRPCLVMAGGLPGTGKSTLAQGLAERAGFSLIRSDVVRKELAGLAETGCGQASATFGEGIYSSDWNERTYKECLRRAETHLFEGKRVLVDGSFREEKRRSAFLEAAVGWGAPGVFLLCTATVDIVRERLRDRRNDASDADWNIYQKAAENWQELSSPTLQNSWEIPTGGSREQAVSRTLEVLDTLHLHR